MDSRHRGRIVFWGSMLSVVSFFIGLTHIFLPILLVQLVFAVAGIALMSIVCVVSTLMYILGIALLTVIALVSNPICIIFLIPLVFFVKRKLARS